MKLHEALDAYARDFPGYFMVAADHRFGCSCDSCVVFHAKCGLDLLGDDSPEWAALRDEDVPGEWLSRVQVDLVMDLAHDLL